MIPTRPTPVPWRGVPPTCRAAWLLAALVPIAAGCPSSSPAPSAAARALCEHLARCYPLDMHLYPGGDVEGCAEVQACLSPGNRPAECAQAIEALECGTWGRLGIPGLPECVPVPAVEYAAEGEDCSAATCGEGLWCAVEGEAPGCELRVCRRRAAAGESCAEAPCELPWNALRCDPEREVCVAPGKRGERCPTVGCEVPLSCVAGRCGERLGTGEPCTSGGDCEGWCDEGRCAELPRALLGEPCDEHLCRLGLRCEHGRCRAHGDVGEPCTFGGFPDAPELLGISLGHDCRLGLACVEGLCQLPTCGLARPGQACNQGLTQCSEGYLCGFDGRCEAIPTPQLGHTCDPDLRERLGIEPCVEGYCDDAELRCVPKAAAGEPCGSSPCADGLTCIEERCVALLGGGEHCETDAQCGPWASCDPERATCVCGP